VGGTIERYRDRHPPLDLATGVPVEPDLQTDAGHPRRWATLVVLCLALAMVAIDNTILAVAIPNLARELHATESDLQWIAAGYGLVLAGLLLPLAVFGDRHGRKGLLIVGLLIFGASSAAASFASTPAQLVVARGVMGIGGACTMPATLAVLGNVFAAPERGRAIAIWSGVAGVATAAGPIAGGLLLARLWWGSVFLVNVPLAAIAVVATIVVVPTSRDPGARPIDRGSAARWWGALTAALVAIIEGPERGWTSPIVIVAAALALALLLAFARRERVSTSRLIPAATARDPRLRAGAATVSAVFFGVFGTQFLLTQWLQGPHGYSALEAGAYFVPNAFAAFVASISNPRWVARAGHRRVVASGLGLMALGTASAALAVAVDSVAGVVAAAVLVGFAIGTAAPSGVELIMSSAPPEHAGAAAGVNETLVEAAGAFGIAVLGTVFATTDSFAWPLPVATFAAAATALVVVHMLRSEAGAHHLRVAERRRPRSGTIDRLGEVE
jgi:MFS family permease